MSRGRNRTTYDERLCHVCNVLGDEFSCIFNLFKCTLSDNIRPIYTTTMFNAASHYVLYKCIELIAYTYETHCCEYIDCFFYSELFCWSLTNYNFFITFVYPVYCHFILYLYKYWWSILFSLSPFYFRMIIY